MSRQLGRLLFLLALWIQFLAPVAAAQVRAADGPLAGVPICGHVADTAGDAAGADQHHGPAAAFCGLCCAAVAVLDAPPASAPGVALAWTVLVFMAPPDGPAAAAAPDVPRARDPPALV